MYFSRYITISILTHLLFVGMLGILSFTPQSKSTVFDVDIVEPIKKYTPPAPKQIKPVIRKRKPMPVRRRRRPPEKNVLPETMFGKGTGAPEERSENSDNSEHSRKLNDFKSDKKNIDPLPFQKEETGPLPSGTEKPSLVPPSSLFDKKTIEKYARKGGTAQKDLSVKKGLTFDTSEFKHRGYMKMLKEKIEGIWKYPKEAERRQISGDLYMKFSIKKNGSIGKVELVRTSGYQFLDNAVMKAIKDGAPYWPLPDDWKKEDLEITGHFIYIFGGAYVM